MSDETKISEPHQTATPEDYALIFESNKVGQRILDDLIKRFAYSSSNHTDGINRILNTFEDKGARKAIDFIVLQINRANGVNDDEQIQLSSDE